MRGNDVKMGERMERNGGKRGKMGKNGGNGEMVLKEIK